MYATVRAPSRPRARQRHFALTRQRHFALSPRSTVHGRPAPLRAARLLRRALRAVRGLAHRAHQSRWLAPRAPNPPPVETSQKTLPQFFGPRAKSSPCMTGGPVGTPSSLDSRIGQHIWSLAIFGQQTLDERSGDRSEVVIAGPPSQGHLGLHKRDLQTATPSSAYRVSETRA